MSMLRSAIDEFQAEELDAIDDDALEADLSELLSAVDMLHAETLRRIGEVERRGSFARDGHLSATAWLVARFRLGWSTANEAVQTARALRSMPIARAAFASGQISRASVSALVHARGAHREAFADAESLLVDAARSLPVPELRRALDHWRSAVDHRDAERAELHRLERRRLHVSPTFDGMIRVDGDLDPENGQVLITALRAICDAGARDGGHRDDRSPAQPRADALGELCRMWLDRPDRPTVAGERSHVSVTIDLDALRRPTGGDAPRAHRARRRVRAPRLRPAAGVDGRPPRAALGARRHDGGGQPRAAVQAASPVRPSGLVRGLDRGWRPALERADGAALADRAPP